MKNICVIGLGYIGLPTASILATKGYDVLGVDIDRKIIDTINKGSVHFLEPDLEILVQAGVKSNKLKASLKPDRADVYIICVPTPFKENHDPDLSHVEKATSSILPYIGKGSLVILESTSPVGTTENIVAEILKESGLKIGKELFIAYCPERVLPGHILKELVENDRVIGGIDKESALKAKELYSSFVNGRIYITNTKTAEMVKLVENSYRDVNIAFANEISMISEEMGIDIWELRELANKHPRVNILEPGPGVGGHCIAVDPWFIVSVAKKRAKIIKTAREVNEEKVEYVIDKIVESINKIKNKKRDEVVVGCMGLTYKPDIDDLRESPAVKIVKRLEKLNIAKLLLCDPNVKVNKYFNVADIDTVLEKSDILVILVSHREFYNIDREKLKEKILIDIKGVFR